MNIYIITLRYLPRKFSQYLLLHLSKNMPEISSKKPVFPIELDSYENKHEKLGEGLYNLKYIELCT